MTARPGSAHAFDFWVGEWDVFGPKGAQVGTSSIVEVLGTGALSEHWHGAGGFEGRSLNAYDATRGHWHQTWLDSTGGVLMLDGGLVDGSMVLEGLAPGEDPSAMLLQRITWTPEQDGVRQHWQSSADDGATCTSGFVGHTPDRPILPRFPLRMGAPHGVSGTRGAPLRPEAWASESPRMRRPSTP